MRSNNHWKRVGIFVLILTISLLPIIPPGKASSITQSVNRFIVAKETKLSGNMMAKVSEDFIQDLSDIYGVKLIDQTETVKMSGDNFLNDTSPNCNECLESTIFYLFETTNDLQNILQQLNDPWTKSRLYIKYAEPNYEYKPCLTFNDPLFENQRKDIEQINAP